MSGVRERIVFCATNRYSFEYKLFNVREMCTQRTHANTRPRVGVCFAEESSSMYRVYTVVYIVHCVAHRWIHITAHVLL